MNSEGGKDMEERIKEVLDDFKEALDKITKIPAIGRGLRMNPGPGGRDAARIATWVLKKHKAAFTIDG